MMRTDYRRRRTRKGLVFVAYLATFIELPFVTVRIFGKPVTVFKRRDGTFFARETACKHQGANLSLGVMEGAVVTCPRHGLKYNLETGECLSGDYPKLRRHKVAIIGDAVYVSTSPLHEAGASGRAGAVLGSHGRILFSEI